MHPTLLKIGPLSFHAYTVAMALAFLVGVLLPIRENYKREHPFPVTPMIGLWIFLGALFGSKVYWILQYDSPWHLYQAFYLWAGGLVFYGGFIGGFIAGVAYLKMAKVPILPAGDIAAPYIALAHAIGRIGCFLNGCCYGSPTSMPWGVRYPVSGFSLSVYQKQIVQGIIAPGAPASAPVHPAPLYAAAGLVAIFLALRYVYKRPHHTGEVLLLYPLFYGILRFTVEIFRGDSARPLLHMSASQMIALGMAVVAGAALVVLRRSIWRAPAAD